MENMHMREGNNTLVAFSLAFILASIVIFLAYFIWGFNVALLVGICLIIGVIGMVATGTENIINTEVANQLSQFRGEARGYLTDIYAEMRKEKK